MERIYLPYFFYMFLPRGLGPSQNRSLLATIYYRTLWFVVLFLVRYQLTLKITNIVRQILNTHHLYRPNLIFKVIRKK